MPSPFIDSNVLVYASSDDPRAERANTILRGPWQTSVQALNEFALAARRKLKMDWNELSLAIADILTVEQPVHPVTLATHVTGLRVAEQYRLQIYDSMMISAALLAGADTFLSEDMHAGLIIDNRLTIVNPFA